MSEQGAAIAENGLSSGLTGLRLTTKEVCDLARFSPVTLWRRIRSGQMPAPIDQGRQSIFDRQAVLSALQSPAHSASACSANPGQWAADAVAQRLATLAGKPRSQVLVGTPPSKSVGRELSLNSPERTASASAISASNP